MSFQHRTLARALGWKFNHQPGMETSDGMLTAWPTMPWPTDAQLAQWVADYEALPMDDPAKDRRASLKARIRQATTLADLKLVLEDLV